MLDHLSIRRREPEWMDSPDADPRMLRRSLGYLRALNAMLGYTRSTISHLSRFSRSWKPGERIDVIDLATGGGDVPRTILRWAKRRGHNLHVVGLDLHAATAAAAADGERDDRLRIVRGNALDPPFADHSFDYAITSLFLHHLSDDDAVGVLSNMDRLTRRGVIAGDLLRHKRAYAWIKLLTIGANPMVRHDAAVSVRQAFLEPEIESMRRRAGLNYVRLHQHFGHRFILAGEKDGALNPGAPLVDNGL